MREVDAVLFDIGGVIVTDGPDMTRVAEMLGLVATEENVARVGAAVWGMRDAYDLGLSDTDYWRRVAAAAGAAAPSGDAVARLRDADVARWASPRADTVGLMTGLHGRGVRVGVLSNAPHALARAFVAQPWTGVLAARVFSCEQGVAKPAAEIFAAAVAELGLDAERVGFFDDRATNVAGAAEAGLRAELWRGAAAAAGTLAGWGVL